MILMALDHVRDFFGVPGVSPTNLAQTTVPLFLTRWITHICAPTFFLLTGTGAFLARSRKSVPELSRFLLIRGVWLILLELTVIRCLGFQFNFDYQVTLLVVIWALGWAMVVLAGLVWLPMPAVLAFGVVMIAGHNLLDGVRSAHPLWVILHSPGFVVNRPGFVVFAAYPLVPWIAVTAVGYALGQIYRWSSERRRRFLLRWGIGLTAGVCCASHAQCLWRPSAVGRAGIRRAHARVIPQRDEISAVTLVSADGSGSGAADPARSGWGGAARARDPRWFSAACRSSTSFCT